MSASHIGGLRFHPYSTELEVENSAPSQDVGSSSNSNETRRPDSAPAPQRPRLISPERRQDGARSLSKARRSAEQRPKAIADKCQTTAEMSAAKLARLYEYIQSLGGAASLLKGWTVTTKLRTNGSSTANRQFDNYYFSPAGKQLRSMKQVAFFLGLIDKGPSKEDRLKAAAAKRLTKDAAGHKRGNDAPASSSHGDDRLSEAGKASENGAAARVVENGTSQKVEAESDGSDVGDESPNDGGEADVEDGPLYAAERLLKQRKRRGRTEYLVRWVGFTEADDTWEPAAHIVCPQLLEEFKSRKEEQRKRNLLFAQRPWLLNSPAGGPSESQVPLGPRFQAEVPRMHASSYVRPPPATPPTCDCDPPQRTVWLRDRWWCPRERDDGGCAYELPPPPVPPPLCDCRQPAVLLRGRWLCARPLDGCTYEDKYVETAEPYLMETRIVERDHARTTAAALTAAAYGELDCTSSDSSPDEELSRPLPLRTLPLRTLPLRTLPLRTLPQQPQQPSRAPGRSFDGFKLEDLDMQYRAALREKAHRWLQEHSVKQKVLAEKLQVPQAQLSLFLSGKFRTSSQGKAVFASVFNFFEGREGHSSEDSRELSACADVLSERSAEGGDAASGSAE